MRRGDRVAIWSINNYEWVVAQLATARIGAVLVETHEDTIPELKEPLDELRERGHWVVRLTQPFAEHSGADPQAAMAPVLAELTEHMDAVGAHFPQGHTLPAEIAAYHRTLDRAFTVAAGDDLGTGAAISRQARSILLDDVLLPYNYLLGQRKKDDTVLGYVAVAQTRFAGWALSELDLPRENARRVFYVFQALCDLAERTRQDLRERWEVSRLVWLPLQLVLTPDQHDSQAELDAIIARATCSAAAMPSSSALCASIGPSITSPIA